MAANVPEMSQFHIRYLGAEMYVWLVLRLVMELLCDQQRTTPTFPRFLSDYGVSNRRNRRGFQFSLI